MTSTHKKYGSNSFGQFWYGGSIGFPGFLYKRNGGAGGRKNPAYGLITGQPQDIWNKYIPGSGVGGSSIATRRAKLRHATVCNGTQTCGRFYGDLTLNQQRPSQTTTYNANFTY